MENNTEDFIKAIDTYTQEQTKKVLSAVDGLNVITFTTLIDIPVDVLERFGLNSDIKMFISRKFGGAYQASYYYKYMEIEPEVDYLSSGEIDLLTMLRESIIQDTNTPVMKSTDREET